MKPTRPQLTYLQALAEQTATTFTYPATKTDASREIRRARRGLAVVGGDERGDGDQVVRVRRVAQAEQERGGARPSRSGAPENKLVSASSRRSTGP